MVTVEKPCTRVFSDEIDRDLAHVAGNDDRIFEDITNCKVVSVKVYWMAHRTSVDHSETDVFTSFDTDWIGIRIRLPVNGPLIPTHHSAGQHEVNRSVWLSIIRIERINRVEIRKLELTGADLTDEEFQTRRDRLERQNEGITVISL
ncbi:hypothetical protein BBD46_02370 [Natrialba sp. SSL1]|nr:hypothetical protein BBD46_02370 [Natrialba sp. SSL1]